MVFKVHAFIPAVRSNLPIAVRKNFHELWPLVSLQFKS